MRIAVTGGIGSGKSAVCGILREEGYPVFSCDEITRELQEDPAYLREVEAAFPGTVEGGRLDRKKLAGEVFSDPVKLARLNGLAHPRIMETLRLRMERHAVSFAEVPLLFESGHEGDFGAVIVVWRDREERIAAVMGRDGATREEVTARMDSQADYARIVREGRYPVLRNDGDLLALKKSLDALLGRLLP